MSKSLADVINAVRQLSGLKLAELATDLESAVALTNHVEELKTQKAALLAEVTSQQTKLAEAKAAHANEEKVTAALKEAQVLVRDETAKLKGHLADLKAKVASIL
jgi:predicted nuclease with TOPRIM domain